MHHGHGTHGQLIAREPGSNASCVPRPGERDLELILYFAIQITDETFEPKELHMLEIMRAAMHDPNIKELNILQIQNLNIPSRPHHEVQILTKFFSHCCRCEFTRDNLKTTGTKDGRQTDVCDWRNTISDTPDGNCHAQRC